MTPTAGRGDASVASKWYMLALEDDTVIKNQKIWNYFKKFVSGERKPVTMFNDCLFYFLPIAAAIQKFTPDRKKTPQLS
ncbi:hypothetical protein QWZ08_00460 [Ferruginibacter paludis]|uniref:hypothetical protein n=1 Tax=Ferruginibacter paludis TaxID=1310417 RepID=UPI0025B28DB8|nr:hypothetical protein [Ferruginibacter paludis]MDN3654073.1 hypothetical protein [Ferruginibacter paludis]